MSRQEFMEQLERLLTDIPEEERTEALTYYNGYFEDAGAENEANIIRELESPEKVAAIIKADIGAEETKVYTEAGYEDVRFRQKEEVGQYTEAAGQKKPQKRSSTEIVLLVLLAVLTSPIWLGLLAGLLGVIVGVFGAVLGILAAFVCTVFALYLAGIVFVCVGIGMFVIGTFGAGSGLLGAGLLVLALAILGTVGCVWVFGKFLPWLFRGTVRLCSRPFQRKEEQVA